MTWWDTGANRWRETRLAGRQLQIEAQPDLSDRTAAEELSRRGSSPTWIWICAVVLACGFLWYGLQTAGGRRWRNRLAAQRDRRVLKNALRDACRRDDAAEARASLRAWAARRWPGEWFYGLSAIAGKFADPGFDRELVKLDAALYAARPPSWRGAGLWDRFLTCERGLSEAAAHRRRVLPRIYPDQSRLPSRAQPFTGAKRSP